MEPKETDANCKTEKEDHAVTSSEPVIDNATIDPVKVSHNTNDLSFIDLNSADDVRQAMNSAIRAKSPAAASPRQEEAQTKQQPLKIHSQTETNTVKEKKKEEKKRIQFGMTLRPRRKRPGRPPQAGNSKRIRRTTISNMYVGKLSNVVSFPRRSDYSSSDSD